jgi:hypothetical protein
MTEPTCVKCNAKMEQGILLDLADSNRLYAVSWVRAPVEKSFWMGLRIKGKPRYEVRAYRCPECGYLESYAK